MSFLAGSQERSGATVILYVNVCFEPDKQLHSISAALLSSPVEKRGLGGWLYFIGITPFFQEWLEVLSNMQRWMDYRRSGKFRLTNVRAFNFRRKAKWRKLNARVRNFHTFNFCSISNWQKNFTAKISQSTVFRKLQLTEFIHNIKMGGWVCLYLWGT